MRPLSQCPSSPNCVSSAEGTDPDHFIQPLQYQGTFKEAKAKLRSILTAMPRTQIVEAQERYWRVECTSLIFRFIDDLEFWFHATEPLIHVRSASRVGYSDFGVNRKRIEMIRAQLASIAD